MKMRILDLMDYYRGDGIKLDSPESIAKQNSTDMTKHTASSKMPRGKRPLLIAAALLLVVAASAAMPFVLARTVDGHAENEGGVPSAITKDELPPEFPKELPTTVSEGSTQETVESGSQVLISPQIIEGAVDVENGTDNCEGNLFHIDGCYYTMTENGPEPVKVQNLTTTVDLYGSWTLRMDYAIIDGILCFRSLGNVTDADTATPYVLKDSPDTVILSIPRRDQGVNLQESCRYQFLYNVLTGEISDPLVNVPELFNHGNVSTFKFNETATRSIVSVYNPDPDLGWDTYVCDMTTGEMLSVATLVEPHVMEMSGTFEPYMCLWASEHILLIWETQAVPAETGETEYHDWLFAYDVEAGNLNYKLQDVAADILRYGNGDVHFPYLHSCESGTYEIISSDSGMRYILNAELWLDRGNYWSLAGDRRILYSDGELYLIDEDEMVWGSLFEFLEKPTEEIISVEFASENSILLISWDRVYCYQLPTDLPMHPWTAE